MPMCFWWPWVTLIGQCAKTCQHKYMSRWWQWVHLHLIICENRPFCREAAEVTICSSMLGVPIKPNPVQASVSKPMEVSVCINFRLSFMDMYQSDLIAHNICSVNQLFDRVFYHLFVRFSQFLVNVLAVKRLNTTWTLHKVLGGGEVMCLWNQELGMSLQ